MKELSLHILDIAQNSITAGASLVNIIVGESAFSDAITIDIIDDGCGMSKELLARVISPFTTSRTTRKVGLGIPMFKHGAESCGGSFEIDSVEGAGTSLRAVYQLSHIDRPPLGDIAETILTLIVCNPDKPDFEFAYKTDDGEYRLDTREIREILDGVPLNEPDVVSWLKENLTEGIEDARKGDGK